MNTAKGLFSMNWCTRADWPTTISADDLTAKISQKPPKSGLIVLNQGSIGACTLFGSAGAYFETYAQAIKPQAYTQPFTLWDIWDVAKSKGAIDTQGWWLQSILQLLVDLKKTGNYVLLGSNNIDDKAIYSMCKAIAEGRNFVTGFYYVDWSEVVKTGKYVKSSRTSGHIVYFNRFKKWNYSDGSRVAFWSPNNWNGCGSFWITENELKNSYIFKQYTWYLAFERWTLEIRWYQEKAKKYLSPKGLRKKDLEWRMPCWYGNRVRNPRNTQSRTRTSW